ncbi:glucose-6-phosphate isomerase [Patescibacteria group bacterium]
MIKLNAQNSQIETEVNSAEISEKLKKIEARNQGFYKIVDDSVDEILKFTKSVEGKYEDIVVLGIGGSALGTICLRQSLTHLHEAIELHVLDNIDPAYMAQLNDILDYSKTLFIVISKSGGTPETLSQYFYFKEKCDNFVFITGKSGFLRETGEKEGVKMFDIPENVGGRFSVLTAVGLLPAALIGIDIQKLLEGAKEMRDKFLSEDPNENIPYQIATLQYLNSKKGRNMTVIMPYSQHLIRFSDWYRQLLAESIGKTKDVGLTPVSALGVTDQHSQSQLYMDGPDDKFFILMKVEDLGPEVVIPGSEIDYLEGVSFNKLMHTEQQGTTDALTHNKKPNITLNVPKVDEFNLGALFMLFEGATAFLGEFYGINAFDQPGVELSKKLTKELLTGSEA